MDAFRTLLLAGSEPLLAPLVINPLSAKLAEAAGFTALYLGGGAMAYVECVTEANLSLTEMVPAGIDIRTDPLLGPDGGRTERAAIHAAIGLERTLEIERRTVER
jgi:hypothetical protein